MAQGAQTSGIISGINVTPLVDITLVLLIVFMVTAKILVDPSVPLDLPKAAHSEEVQVLFAVTMPRTGPLQINGEVVGDDRAFVDRARMALVRDPELRAVIQADGALPHADVIHTLDLLREAGVARIAFAAIPEAAAVRP